MTEQRNWKTARLIFDDGEVEMGFEMRDMEMSITNQFNQTHLQEGFTTLQVGDNRFIEFSGHTRSQTYIVRLPIKTRMRRFLGFLGRVFG